VIVIESVDGNGTLELVTDDRDAEGLYVQEALAGSDWEDTWDEAPFEDGFIRMRFDKGDQAAILRLLNAHTELNVARCSG
jgi:hypothetical protein